MKLSIAAIAMNFALTRHISSSVKYISRYYLLFRLNYACTVNHSFIPYTDTGEPCTVVVPDSTVSQLFVYVWYVNKTSRTAKIPAPPPKKKM